MILFATGDAVSDLLSPGLIQKLFESLLLSLCRTNRDLQFLISRICIFQLKKAIGSVSKITSIKEKRLLIS